MSGRFRPLRGGAASGAGAVVEAVFVRPEAMLLRQLVSQVVMLLEAETGVGRPGGDGDRARLAQLDPELAAMGLADLAQLGDEVGGDVAPPGDEVVARLLPDAYDTAEPACGEEDPGAAAADFRRYTQRRLVSGKQVDAQAVLDVLPSHEERPWPGDEEPDDAPVLVRLDADAAQHWLRAINDVRLSLGTRLGVSQDDDDRWEHLAPGDPRGAMHDVYQWLGFVQETLVMSLAKLRRRRPATGGDRGSGTT